MSVTKLKLQPIAEQIAYYERQVNAIEERIVNGRKQQREFRRIIRSLQRPDAEEKYQKRLADHNRQMKQKKQPMLKKGMSKGERLDAIFDFINKNY